MKQIIIFACWLMIGISTNLMSTEEILSEKISRLTKPLAEDIFINSLFQLQSPCYPVAKKDRVFSAESALDCAIKHDEQYIVSSLLKSSLIRSSSPIDLSLLLHKAMQRNVIFKRIKDTLHAQGHRFSNEDPFIMKYQKNESIISLLKLKQTQSFHQAIKERDEARVAQFLREGASIIYLVSGKNAIERASELFTTALSPKAYARAQQIMNMLIKRRDIRFLQALYQGDFLCVQQMMNLGATGLTQSNHGVPAIIIARTLFSKSRTPTEQVTRGAIITLLQATLPQPQKEKTMHVR